MKKVYSAPELEVTIFELTSDILSESAEQAFDNRYIFVDDYRTNGSPFGF